MKITKVVVTRKSDDVIVYGNEGAESKFKTAFENEIKARGFDSAEYTIDWIDTSNKLVIEKRKIKYRLLDDERIEAMVEKLEGSDVKWNAYMIKRNAIKAAHPKS